MAGFVIGTVLEPETVEMNTKQGVRLRVVFGLRVGRRATEYQVWDNDRTFDKALELRDGQSVCAIIGYAVDDRGRLKEYLNDVAECPPDLRVQFLKLFSDSAAKSAPAKAAEHK